MQNAVCVRLHEGTAHWLCRTLDIDNDRSPRTRSSGFTSGNEGRPRAETQSRHDDASFWREYDRNRRNPSTSNPQHNGNLCQARLRWSTFIGSPVAQRWGRTMNSLDQALKEYIAIRRALGFELREVTGPSRATVSFLLNLRTSLMTKEMAPPCATPPA